MRVAFCGNPEFAVPTLTALLGSAHEVVAVVTSPDKPRGRGRKVGLLPVKATALLHTLPLFQPESLRDPLFLDQLGKLNPDALVVVAFRILPRELFALPTFGSFNVHPSLLPKYRGPAPIRWTLLNGDSVTGVSIIQLTEEIDGGGILLQQRTEISQNENYGELHDRLAVLGASMLIDVLDKFNAGVVPEPILQDAALSTRAPKLFSINFLIDWSQPAETIRNKVRALSPEPGAMTRGAAIELKILDCTALKVDRGLPAGTVLIDSDAFIVGTGTLPLQLERVQPSGKRPMSAADFLRGRPKLPHKFD